MTEDSRAPREHRFLRMVQEAYAFACLHCGHAWEQTYDIEHHVDAADRPFILYYSGGQRVPSPLARLTCLNCEEHKVRIMRAGQAAAVRSAQGLERPAPPH